jgi:hypothetical protein
VQCGWTRVAHSADFGSAYSGLSDAYLLYLGLGDDRRAMDEFERAYGADSQMLAWLGQDRLFDPLRSEPRFVDLLRRIGFDRARQPASRALLIPFLFVQAVGH